MPYVLFILTENGRLIKLTPDELLIAKVNDYGSAMEADASRLYVASYSYDVTTGVYLNLLEYRSQTDLSVEKTVDDFSSIDIIRTLCLDRAHNIVYYHVNSKSKYCILPDLSYSSEVDLGFTPTMCTHFWPGSGWVYYSDGTKLVCRQDTGIVDLTDLLPTTAEIVQIFPFPKEELLVVAQRDGYLTFINPDHNVVRYRKVADKIDQVAPLDTLDLIVFGIVGDYYYIYDYANDTTHSIPGPEGMGLYCTSGIHLASYSEKGVFMLYDENIDTYFNATIYDKDGNVVENISVDIGVTDRVKSLSIAWFG